MRKPTGRRSPTTVRSIGAAWSLAAEAARGTTGLYVLLNLATGVLPVVTAWLTKLVIDALTARTTVDAVLAPAAGLAAVGVLAGLAPQLTRYLRGELEREVGVLAQDRLFAAVNRIVGLGPFEDPAFLNRLRLAQQAGRNLPNQSVDGALGVLRAGVTISGFLGSISLLSPVMTALVLLSGLPALAAGLLLSRRRAAMLWDIGPAERREFFYSELLSSAAAAKEVRLFGLGAFLRTRMLTERRSANRARRSLERREFALQAGLGLLTAVVAGGGLLWAVRAAQAGTLSVGDIVVFLAAVAGVQSALGSLAAEIAQLHHALLMFKHYRAVTTAGPDLPTAPAPQQLPPLHRGIELRDVWFRYSPEHPWVLRGVDLTIRKGEAVALVGLNGAGKSTLVNLLCRFYDPTRGSILWDGVDLRQFVPTDLRRRIGAVFQDYMHYDLTAAENIALGDLDALHDRDRIHAAAEQAGIHRRLATLPHGYDTLLSRMYFPETSGTSAETGVQLSGGQWQRVALARAFLRDQYELVILDEPSSGLDAEAEYEIHNSLRRHRSGRTSLLISHRLNTVRDADTIVVLDGGRIVEQGDHSSLLEIGGTYARLFTRQSDGYREQPDEQPAPAGHREQPHGQPSLASGR